MFSKFFQENCFKSNLQVQDKAIRDTSSSHGKELENDIHTCVSILKRKLKLQHLDAHERTMPCKASKSTEENQDKGDMPRGILRNHAKALSRHHSKKSILQLNPCSTQKGNKHVTFSEKNNKLSRKLSHSECSKWQKVCGSDVVNVEDAGVVGKDSTVLETNGIEDVSIRIAKEVDAGFSSKEQLSRLIVDSTTFMKQKNEEELFGRYESSERSALLGMNQPLSENGFFYVPLEGYHNDPNIHVVRKSSNSTTSRRLENDLGTPHPTFPPMYYEPFLETYNEASVSRQYNMERRTKAFPQASLQSAMNNANNFQFQAFPRPSPEELLHPFRSQGKRSLNGLNEDFVGLPLNSQGELIRLNPSAKRDFNDKMNSSASAFHSMSSSLPSSAVSKCLDHLSESGKLDCRTSSMDQLNLFPVESYVKQNPVVDTPYRLDISESPSDSNTNFDLDFLKINEHAFLESENTVCKEDNQVQKIPENEQVQSTMRLMGKEFVVGGRGVQGFEDGSIWKDKQIVEEFHFGHHPESDIMVQDQINQPSLRKSRGTLFCPSEFTIDRRSEAMCAIPHSDYQTSSMNQGVFVARKRDRAQKIHPSFHPGNFPEFYNIESSFSPPCTNGYESQLFTLEIPTRTASHQESYPNVSPSAIQLTNKQSLARSSLSAIRFPFMHPDMEGHTKAYWNRRSSVNQPPLWFDVPKSGKQSSNSQSQYSPGHNYPCMIPAASHGTDFSASLKPEAFLFSSSATTKRHGNQKKIMEPIKSRTGTRGVHNGNNSNVPFQPIRMPTFGYHEGYPGCATKTPRTCASFGGSVQNVGRAFESCLATNRTEFMMCSEYEGDKDEHVISPCMDTARIGPIKLTAGAKHILKARQQKDQCSTMSADPEISVSATTTGFRFP